MRRSWAFLVAVLSAAPLASPVAADPAGSDVVWLAELLGGPVDELPPTMPITEFAWGPEGLSTWDSSMTIEEVARFVRETAELEAGEDGPAPDVILGAGVRGITGDRGIFWAGQAFGLANMPCLEISSVPLAVDVPETPAGPAQQIAVEVPDNEVNSGGGVDLLVSAALAEADEGMLFRLGAVLMDVQILPAQDTDVAIGGVYSADSAVKVGYGFTSCRMVFNLRFTFGFFGGDGNILA